MVALLLAQRRGNVDRRNEYPSVNAVGMCCGSSCEFGPSAPGTLRIFASAWVKLLHFCARVGETEGLQITRTTMLFKNT